MQDQTEKGRETNTTRLMKFTDALHQAIIQQKDVVWTRTKPSVGEIWVQTQDENEFTIKIDHKHASTTSKV